MVTDPARYLRAVLLTAVALLASAQARAVPEIQTWQTVNGAKVLFIPAPGIPMVDVRITYRAGSAYDDGKPGLSRLTNRLLDEGAGQWSANAISERFDDVGAQFKSGTLRDMAWVSLRSLTDPDWLDKAVETFQAVISKPVFAADSLDLIRSNMLTSLQARDESPSKVGEERWYEEVYGDHPYASSPEGSKEFLEAAEVAQVKAFYKRHYVGRNAVMAIVGDLDRAAAGKLAERLMADVPAGERSADLPPVKALADARDIRIDFPSTQSTVFSGHPGMSRKDPDYYVLYTGNYILGGSGLVSRLSEEIRDKRGLSYSVTSYFLPMAEPGPFEMKLQTKNDQAQEATNVMRETLQRFVDKGPDADELQAAIKGITGGFPLRIDNNSKLVQYLAMIGFYDLPIDYLETFPGYIEAITVEDIRDAFRRRVDPARMVTVTVGGQ